MMVAFFVAATRIFSHVLGYIHSAIDSSCFKRNTTNLLLTLSLVTVIKTGDKWLLSALSHVQTYSLFHLFYAPPSNSVHMGLVYNDIHQPLPGANTCT